MYSYIVFKPIYLKSDCVLATASSFYFGRLLLVGLESVTEPGDEGNESDILTGDRVESDILAGDRVESNILTGDRDESDILTGDLSVLIVRNGGAFFSY